MRETIHNFALLILILALIGGMSFGWDVLAVAAFVSPFMAAVMLTPKWDDR